MSQVYSLAQSFTGARLLKDPETGLLFSNQTVGFTLLLKKKFMEVAVTYYPDITTICAIIGISKGCYKSHYMVDQVFREYMDSLEEGITDKIEASMAKFALQSGNFMDRIAWLRAHRGSKYNEKKILSIEANLSKTQLDTKKSNLIDAVDAEVVQDATIVESVQTAKLEQPK
jgi:hypothetical protein